MPIKHTKRKTDESPKPVTKFLKDKAFRDNRLWSYSVGENTMFTFVNGKRLTTKEFDKKYPVFKPVHFYVNLENPDTTKTYLQ